MWVCVGVYIVVCLCNICGCMWVGGVCVCEGGYESMRVCTCMGKDWTNLISMKYLCLPCYLPKSLQTSSKQ